MTYLRNLLKIPAHVLYCLVALVFALAEDRTATLLFIGGVILGLTVGLPAVGAVLVLYGVLLFVHQIAVAALSR